MATNYKFVIALNKALEPGVAMNAAGHMALGLMAMVPEDIRSQMKFMDYQTKDGVIHPSISAWPVIILRGKEGEIKKLQKNAEEQGMPAVNFIDTMTGGTYQEQMENTTKKREEDLVFYGVATFGEKEKLDELTKRFSLWR